MTDLDANDAERTDIEEPDEDGKYAASEIPDSQLRCDASLPREIGFSKLLTAEGRSTTRGLHERCGCQAAHDRMQSAPRGQDRTSLHESRIGTSRP